jgi:hypothetical protein
MRMLVLAGAVSAAMTLMQVEARAEGPWCARDSDGCTSCAYQTRAQCVASVSGTGGSCERNPSYSSSADARGRKTRSN